MLGTKPCFKLGNRFAVLTLAFLLALVFGGRAGAEGTGASGLRIVFPPTVEIKGPDIILGECAELQGPPEMMEKVKGINLGKAAFPGQSRRLNRGSVLIRLRRVEIDPASLALDMPEEVVVKTRGQQINGEKLQASIHRAFLQQLPYPGLEVKVEILGLPSLFLPEGEILFQPKLDEITAKRAASAGTGTVPVDVLVDGERLHTIRIRVGVGAQGPVLVSNQDLESKTILTHERVSVETRGWKLLPADVLHTPDDVEGLRLTRTIRTGEILTGGAVEEIPAIEKGQMLVLKVETDGMLMTLTVKAMEDGFINQPLRVENLDSGRILTAVLVGPREAVLETW